MRKYFSLVAALLMAAAGSAAAQEPAKAPVTQKPAASAASTPAQGQVSTPATEKQSESASAVSAQDKTAQPIADKPAGKAGGDVAHAAKAQPIQLDSGYVIGPEDVLDIEVWQEKEFSREVPVRPDGKITLPLLNDIQAAGMTPNELAASIAKLLEKYVTGPQVTVIVGQIRSRLIYISGEVNKPGALPLLTNMTVLQAISMVGGPNQLANAKKIYVLRTENGKQVVHPFNYKEAIKGKDLNQNILLKPGDTIVVP
jgi:polysaccharide export outer membrane protein